MRNEKRKKRKSCAINERKSKLLLNHTTLQIMLIAV
jgi:hypothetical protein